MTKRSTCLLLFLTCCPVLAAGADRAKARKLSALAGRQMQAGQFEKATETWQELLALEPPPAVALKAQLGLLEICCRRRDFGATPHFEAQALKLLAKAGDDRAKARLLYFQAVVACESGKTKMCLAALRKAVATSEDAILWANDDQEFFIGIRLLDDDSPTLKEFTALTDLSNVDKELRAEIQALCDRAKREGKRVLLNFDGRWCPWCRDMDTCLEQPEVKAALEGYLVLKIDVGRFDRHQAVMDELIDRKEIPALVILDGDGNRVVHLPSKDYEDREKRRNDPQRLAKLLREHSK